MQNNLARHYSKVSLQADADQSDTACLSLFFMVLLFIACWLEVSRAAQWCSVNMPHSKAVVSNLSGAFLCACVGFLPQSRHVHARLTGASVLAVGKDVSCVNLAYSANHFVGSVKVEIPVQYCSIIWAFKCRFVLVEAK